MLLGIKYMWTCVIDKLHYLFGKFYMQNSTKGYLHIEKIRKKVCNLQGAS